MPRNSMVDPQRHASNVEELAGLVLKLARGAIRLSKLVLFVYGVVIVGSILALLIASLVH